MSSKASATVTLSSYRDTQSITRYYKLGTSTPTKPTTNPPSGWTDTEPTYTSGSTNSLYFCDIMVFSDGTYVYTAVSKSSSYEAAKAAYTKAVSVETRISSAETAIEQNQTNIALKASKTEFNALEKNLTDNYYTKTQTDTKLKVESDKIAAAVSRISENETAISELELTADGLSVRLDTTDSNVATAQSTANTAKSNAATAQSTANSVKTDLANNYTKKSLPDTRNDNQPPSWYFTNYPKQIITEFKSCSTIGLSGVGTYCTLQTVIPWNDKSGGYPKQTAKVEGTGKEYWRVGTSTSAWSDWIDPYGLANTANTNAGNAAKTATNYLNFSSSGLVVGDMTASTLGKNVLIDSDSVDIRNWLKVTPTETTLSDMSNSGLIRPWQKTLWTGTWYMVETQTITLSEAISAQPNGIVLLFREYVDGVSKNSGLHTYYVPKTVITDGAGWGHSISWAHHNGNYYICKYLYINDTTIKGNALNNDSGTAMSPSGITPTNNRIILWKVYGV